MSNWPISSPFSGAQTTGADPANSAGTAITCGVRSLGAWTELVASSAADWAGFWVQVENVIQIRGYMQIGVGPSGSEVPICELPTKIDSFRNLGIWTYEPIAIAAGSRVSIRASGSTTAEINGLITGNLRNNFGTPSSFCNSTLYGLEKAGGSSTHGRGTLIDPGGVANTKGAWAELEANMPAHRAIKVFIQDGSVSAQAVHFNLLDAGIGAAGSEIIMLPDLLYYVNAGEIQGAQPQQFPWALAADQRLAFRTQSDIIDATDRVMRVSVVGYD